MSKIKLTWKKEGRIYASRGISGIKHGEVFELNGKWHGIINVVAVLDADTKEEAQEKIYKALCKFYKVKE